ncbi:MAG: iron-containing alcohol dehydrogenase [Desulfamplus sp.]|nr:iron-containing alcohol dehydrogenase [Desulfamplus sp.]
MDSNICELRKFVAPEFLIGVDALKTVGGYVSNFGINRVLVVTDNGVISAGWVDKVVESLTSYGLKSVVFSDVTPNPKDYEVMAGAALFLKESCDLIVAVGGGSPMDCAKGIGIVSTNEADILEFEGVDKVTIPGPPLICIPTTAGTAADISQFAIIGDTKRKVKIAIISKSMVPDLAIIDPMTTITMSPKLTAETGIDALVHAFEAYVSNASSTITDINAIKAIELINNNLQGAYNEPDNIDYRYQMMLASLLAGLAFSNASLGIVHSMAHSLGGAFDLAHGECNAILLEHAVDYNFKYAQKKYCDIARAMGVKVTNNDYDYDYKDNLDGDKVLPNLDIVRQKLVDRVGELRKGVGINTKLSQMGIKKENISQLANFALSDPCVLTNPVMPTQEDVEKIYAKLF